MGFLIVVALVVFILSNRVPVLIGFWPFGTVSAWLGPLVVGTFALGFFIGLVAGMPRQLGWRRRARVAEKQVAELSGQYKLAQSNYVQPSASS